MSENNNSTRSSNASNSVFGWLFQIGAGMVLMLDNIKELTSLKMEGKYEDIEITLPNGKIYAQAKSYHRMGDDPNALDKLKRALKTLEKDNQNLDAKKLIYITNISNPLSSQLNSAFNFGHTYDFSTLSDEDQNKITKYIGPDFPTDKFQIQLLNFFGEGDNKFDAVKDKIKEFLFDAIGQKYACNKIFEQWYVLFMNNAGDKPVDEQSYELDKQRDIVYPLILCCIYSDLNYFDAIKDICPCKDIEDINELYYDVMEQRICDYAFASNVSGDYQSKKKLYQSHENPRKAYIEAEWRHYECDFLSIGEDCERETVIKLILYKTLKQKDVIGKIKGAANL